LIIAGPDNEGHLARMQALARDLKLERVHFVGPLYGRDKWLAYRNSELFVLPTYSENFGLAVAEALAAGTPAIVTRGAPWEGLEKHEAGWWIDIGLEALIAAFERALNLPRKELRLMGERGRRWVASEYSWSILAEHGRCVQLGRWERSEAGLRQILVNKPSFGKRNVVESALARCVLCCEAALLLSPKPGRISISSDKR
jgi:glycosyltransferase involved in cell wall biosynthesis